MFLVQAGASNSTSIKTQKKFTTKVGSWESSIVESSSHASTVMAIITDKNAEMPRSHGLNILSNRLTAINNKIEYEWLNKSLNSFKLICKPLFLTWKLTIDQMDWVDQNPIF